MTNLETVTDAAKEVLSVLGEGYEESKPKLKPQAQAVGVRGRA